MTSWWPAMVATHVPYLIAAAALIVVVRRVRRLLERIASELEER